MSQTGQSSAWSIRKKRSMSCRAWMAAGEWVETSIPSRSGVEQPSTMPPRRPCTSIMHMRQEPHGRRLGS